MVSPAISATTIASGQWTRPVQTSVVKRPSTEPSVNHSCAVPLRDIIPVCLLTARQGQGSLTRKLDKVLEPDSSELTVYQFCSVYGKDYFCWTNACSPSFKIDHLCNVLNLFVQLLDFFKVYQVPKKQVLNQQTKILRVSILYIFPLSRKGIMI